MATDGRKFPATGSLARAVSPAEDEAAKSQTGLSTPPSGLRLPFELSRCLSAVVREEAVKLHASYRLCPSKAISSVKRLN
ncbi:hypothetical protein SKAU_G00049180 [Synaphobranchus kaupii]|uniref:Uncharacterized protein n=1 Tax=Synaphobranchus kaupii TaxID=118154 RepID=A0A9Q1G3H3_SYNKA|nr:hypothetical protein SKAU_G00049180 [Synaphobranchus kaupii]